MFKHILRRFLCTATAFTLALASGAGVADDTEIYFSSGNVSGNTGAAVLPNVLFILDTSISMDQIVPNTGNKSRMQVLKEALDSILTDVTDINVGIMRFNYQQGGSVILPVHFIDDVVTQVVGESDIHYNIRLSNGNDDALQNMNDNSVSLTDSTLIMTDILPIAAATYEVTGNSSASSTYSVAGPTSPAAIGGGMYLNSNSRDADETISTTAMNTSNTTLQLVSTRLNAFRFTGLPIPKGATINAAFLDFTISAVQAGTPATNTMTIKVETTDNSPTITTGNSDISSRSYSTSSVAWTWSTANGNLNPAADTLVSSPDIKSLVQLITDRAGWNTGQAILFKISSSSTKREIYSVDGTATTSKRPTLRVRYTIPGVTGVNYQTALRFPTVNIPQGASVTSAQLIFTPQAANTETTDWTIKAQAHDNSPALAATASNISSRTTTAASSTWTVPNWSTNSVATPASINLDSVVQEVVNRSGWCGGHALTFIITGTGVRRAKSVEQASSTAPLLEYAYNLNGTNGCTSKSKTWQVNAGSDDVEETEGGGSDGAMNMGNNGDLDIDASDRVGMRFTNVQIPKNANISSAAIEFTATVNNISAGTKTIQGQAADNPATFTSTTNDVTNRTKTAASVSWTLSNWSANQAYQTVDIKTIVQELVNRAGWASGNAMAFFVYGATGTRAAYNYETSGQSSPRLKVTFDGPAEDIVKTVRERAIEISDQLVASDYTPSVPALYEAAHYWRGQSVVFGLTRNNKSTSRLSHPGSYCADSNNCNGADTNSYPPFGVNSPVNCDSSTDPGSSNCAGEVIAGSPTYISPFNSELSCQRNYQVFLTDGAANIIGSSATNIRNEYLGGASCIANNTLGTAYTSSQACGVDVAKFLFNNDQNSTLNNVQNVLTYTIAFNLTSPNDVQWLKDMAHEGTGGTDAGYFPATNAADLVSAFNKILTDVKKDPTSFVAPSLATNAFNRLLSRDEVYFGLFTPDLATRWFGNVKKYKICIDSTNGTPSTTTDDCTLGEILDAEGDAAVDPTDNKFSETATSIWSDVVDGQATTKGGAGGEITDYTARKIYTDATSAGTAPASGTKLDFATNPGYQIDSVTWDDTNLAHIRSAVCPTPSTNLGTPEGVDCQKRMLWMLGKVIDVDATNDTSSTTRWSVNDVLHSSPVIITYGGSDSDSDGAIDTFFDKLVVGTNEGGVRFVNGSTGTEEWTFMPKPAFNNEQQLFNNPETAHLYGMDLTPTIQTHDVNGNGQIKVSDGDFVRVFEGMRLGGDFYYGLDVSATLTSTTSTLVPGFLWRIQGSLTGTATTGFERIGRTWSQPRLATIFIDNSGTPVKTEVLIFGGGYDTALDDCFGTNTLTTPAACTSGGADNKGNALYIVNPATGARILSISGTGSGADIVVANMHYSIPTRITVTDSDGDGVDDRLYFGDTGGQVWRVDLGTDVKAAGTSRAGHTVVGRLANLAVAGSSGVNERRFFEPPSIVQVKDALYSDASGGEFDYVLIGSGWRQHPLNKDVDDRFYALRDKNIGTMVDANNNNLADSYPMGTSPATTAITDADLIDVTSQVLDSTNTDHTQSLGWYYDFTSSGNDGEKVLSAPITIAGTVFFTTYLPDAQTSTDQCSANIGGGRAYNFNILNAAATIDWNLDDSVDELGDRSKELGGGIPSDVVPVFTKEGIVGIVGIEGGAAQLGTLSGLPRFRTYWYEESGT